MSKYTLYLKAIYGAVAAALTAAQAIYLTSHHIGWQGAIGIAIAAVTALGVIWGVPNYSK